MHVCVCVCVCVCAEIYSKFSFLSLLLKLYSDQIINEQFIHLLMDFNGMSIHLVLYDAY